MSLSQQPSPPESDIYPNLHNIASNSTHAASNASSSTQRSSLYYFLGALYYKKQWSLHSEIGVSDYYLTFNDELEPNQSEAVQRDGTLSGDAHISGHQQQHNGHRTAHTLQHTQMTASMLNESILEDDDDDDEVPVPPHTEAEEDEVSRASHTHPATSASVTLPSASSPVEQPPQHASPHSLTSSSLFESLSKSFSSAFDVVKSKTRWGAEHLLDMDHSTESSCSFPSSPANSRAVSQLRRISNQSNSSDIPKLRIFLHEIRLIQVYQNILTIYLKNAMLVKLMVLDPAEVGGNAAGVSTSSSQTLVANSPTQGSPLLSSMSPTQQYTPRSIALAKKLKALLKHKIRKAKYVGLNAWDLSLVPEGESQSHHQLFDINKEYTRQRVLKQTNDNPNEIAEWRITTVNMNFAVCQSYPQLNVVPYALTDQEIVKAAGQRANGRFPILAWASPTTGVSISRASQPCYGLQFFSGNSLEDDQYVLKRITATNPHSGRLAVIDLRSKLAANANRIKGYGFEIDYADVDLHFMNIGNIHAVRSSYFKVLDLVHATGGNTPNWLSQLEKSQWLEFILLLLHTAEFCKNLMVKQRQSCLLHCSDSWDRSSQAISLVMVMMDPYYRTLEGFAVLIQKEWLSPGHLWKTRNLVGLYSPKSSQYSPIFFQFVEALWSLVRKYPDAFEFNEAYLLALSDAIYSGEYVDFLSNNDQERLNLPRRTRSFFSSAMARREQFVNEKYERREEVLSAQLRHCDVDLWKGWWLRFTDYL